MGHLMWDRGSILFFLYIWPPRKYFASFATGVRGPWNFIQFDSCFTVFFHKWIVLDTGCIQYLTRLYFMFFWLSRIRISMLYVWDYNIWIGDRNLTLVSSWNCIFITSSKYLPLFLHFLERITLLNWIYSSSAHCH